MIYEEVTDFLYRIGFTDDEVDEFYEQDYDFIDRDGNKSRGPDCLYAITRTDEDFIDLNDTGELIEAYWERGWISDFSIFHRQNFDSYRDNYYMVFPTRYKLPNFKLTKSLRRVLNKNRDLKTIIRPLRITPAKTILHQTHHLLRFGKPPLRTLHESYKYIVHHPAELMELCIFKDERLVACSIFEVGNFAIYSNTAFWDITLTSRSLGTLTVLLEVQYALRKNMFYYYLGHFFPQNPNYHYKTRFTGLELYDWDSDMWVDFTVKSRIKKMLTRKLPRHKD
jgi:leucyl-tRNA---protein transferase